MSNSKVVSVKDMKMYGGVDDAIHSFLTSELGRGDLSGSPPGPFLRWENAPPPHNLRIGDWVDA